MCGIIGQINRGMPIHLPTFNAKRDTLRHRGPDDAHTWLSPDARVALGHRRLSFLDLSSAGRQPMCNEDKTLWLTFNGEIYNYIELRSQLQQLGHIFQSATDSEVLLHGYEEWGVRVLQKLKGMFAFGIWNEKNRTLFLARDRFGIKPLYYGWLEDQFYFASELKAIIHDLPLKPVLNHSAICDYLTYRYIPSPHTIWKNLYKLPPAHYLLIHIDNNSPNQQPVEYWQLKTTSKRVPDAEAIEMVNDLLKKSVAEHLRSDIQIGSFLSGGYDSSALVYYMTKQNYNPKTFSIGFKDWEQSEHYYAKIVADHLGAENYNCIVGNEQFTLIDKLVYHYDEPIADISIIPTYLVSQLASRQTKAVLSGEGADEIFGGYTWQKEIAQAKSGAATWAFAKQWLSGGKNAFVEKYAEAMAMGRFTHYNFSSYLHPDFMQFVPEHSEWFYAKHHQSLQTPLKAFQYLDIKTFMGELVLTKIDRASMAHSLEVRVPFLDHELVEYVYNLHQNIYFKPDVTKHLLKENIKKALPASILDRRKQGFVGPDRYYMNIEWYAKELHSSNLVNMKIIKKETITYLLQEKSHWHLWKLLVLEKWLQVWCK